MDLLTPVSIDDACQFKTGECVLATTDNAGNRYAMHDKGNPKVTSPFLKSNYKYKRRIRQILPPEGITQVIPISKKSNISLVTEPEQSETKHSRHLRLPLIDSYFELIALGFIASAVIIFRDILLNSLKRVPRAWCRVWCINSNKIHHRLSKMSGEVKTFATDGCNQWRRYAANAAIRWSKSSGLECFSASLKLIYLTLFIALWMTVYEVEAGTCWMERADNGKCKKIFASDLTKAQCCSANQMHSYTDESLSSVEHFFVLALDGDKKCSPCLESCKDVVCGPNKRCVKRQGRPKCICSPQCGSGKKHKKAHKRKQQLQIQQSGSLKPPHVIDVSRSKEHVSLVNFHSPITVRDVRSLSSEIHSNPSAVSTMILTSPGDEISQSNSRRKNQRISTNPTKKQVNQPMAHQHRPNHQHHHHRNQNKEHHKQQQEQGLEQEQGRLQLQHRSTTVARRRHANTDRNKGDKIIITADDRIRHSTERDSDLPESNSLGDSVNRAALGTGTDTHQAHQQPHGPHARHHLKKHDKPKRKIVDHNSVYNGTATIMTTTGMGMEVSEGKRSKMKQTERRQRLPQTSAVLLATSFASSAPDQQRAKKQKPGPMLHPSVGTSSSSANNRELHLGQDYVDDLTLDDKIHNEFFRNGFPYAHQELSTDEDRYNHPVCGSDGRTYNTECQLKKRACRTDNHALVVAYRGHCQTSCKEVNCLNGLQCVEDNYAIPHCIVCSIQCPLDDAAGQRIDPERAVCGVDGNTYKSTCDINRMVCKIGRSIAVAYPGPCREDRVTCGNINCGQRMTCLRDLRTDQPRCVSCRFKCPRKRRPSNLRYEDGKLCGSNNRTYHSWCEMKKESCSTGFYIDIMSIGSCKSG